MLKITYTYATARRLSGMPRGLCYVDVFSVPDLFVPPEEGRGMEFTRQLAILANCTTIIAEKFPALSFPSINGLMILHEKSVLVVSAS